MPIAFVQQKVEQSTTSVASFTTSAMTVTAGNALVSGTSVNLNTPMVTTDSRGDVFAPQIDEETPSSGGLVERVQLDVAFGAVGGSTTFTVTPTSPGFVSIGVLEFSGAASSVETESHGRYGTGQIDQICNPGPIEPPSAGDLYLSAWTHSGVGSETFTPAAGWTLRANLTNTANMPLGSASFIGSGLQTGTCTLSGSAAPVWDAVVLAIRAADVSAPDPNGNPVFMVSGDRP